jgi:hypothetical protein
MQVVGAVGWGNARLPIPSDMVPVIADLIRRTWAEPADRPNFSEIISVLKPLQHASYIAQIAQVNHHV